MAYLPKVYSRFSDRYPDVQAAHKRLAQQCYDAGPMDERTARLVKLGIAVGAQAEGAVRSHARRALEDGIPADEIRQVAVLAMTTAGFPTTIAGMSWVDEVLDAG
jgi:4-carboxymuconolactone decarboxylase